MPLSTTFGRTSRRRAAAVLPAGAHDDLRGGHLVELVVDRAPSRHCCQPLPNPGRPRHDVTPVTELTKENHERRPAAAQGDRGADRRHDVLHPARADGRRAGGRSGVLRQGGDRPGRAGLADADLARGPRAGPRPRGRPLPGGPGARRHDGDHGHEPYGARPRRHRGGACERHAHVDLRHTGPGAGCLRRRPLRADRRRARGDRPAQPVAEGARRGAQHQGGRGARPRSCGRGRARDHVGRPARPWT